jgi:molybdopterin-guanine dinucleotide biosynthesis protein A
VDAAILAGGRARRFGGRDKSALRVGRASILARQLRALHGLAERVIIVGAPDCFRERGVTVVADLLQNAGALGGIYTALSAARSDHVLVLACDLPFVTASLLTRLMALAGEDSDAVVPRAADGWQPLCAVYARRLMAPIRHHVESGHLKVVDLLAAVRVHEFGPDEIAAVDPDGQLFFNVNTPDDLKQAARLARRADRRLVH